jgi:GNAT superfamily N-acetyltransferase
MSAQTHEIRSFHLRSAAPEQYASLNAFKNVLRREILPDDPPVPCDEDIRRWQRLPALIHEAAWAAWDASGKRILAFGQADIYQTGDNPRLVEVKLEVLPEFRQQGLGAALLCLITDHARNQARAFAFECNDRVPAGSEFLMRIGGTKGLDEPTNELKLAELDRVLLERWMEHTAPLSAEFAMGLWECSYPEEQLQPLADLLQVVANHQPRGALTMEDINYSPDMMRQFDAAQRAAGDQRWSLYLTSRANGSLAGISEVYWNPNRPAILWQGIHE